jgi:hypothetical protein
MKSIISKLYEEGFNPAIAAAIPQTIKYSGDTDNLENLLIRFHRDLIAVHPELNNETLREIRKENDSDFTEIINFFEARLNNWTKQFFKSNFPDIKNFKTNIIEKVSYIGQKTFKIFYRLLVPITPIKESVISIDFGINSVIIATDISKTSTLATKYDRFVYDLAAAINSLRRKYGPKI